MAITGTKLFTAGSALLAADVNQYLARGVKVYADAATRDAAYGGAGEPTLEEGETCYLLDINAHQFYTGTVWTTYPGPGLAYSATVPANPVDGQFWVHQPAGTANGWLFRYNASSLSAYKWECIGNSPRTNVQLAGANTGAVASGAWSDTTTNSLTYTTPFAGAWMITATMSLACTAIATVGMGIARGATNPTLATDTTQITHTAANMYLTHSLTWYSGDFASGTVFTAKYVHLAGTNQTINRLGGSLQVFPLRVG